MTGKFLGKIVNAKFGKCPDRPFLFGLQLSFSFDGGYGVDDVTHLINMDKPTEHHNFTEEEQKEYMVEEYKFIYNLLKDAKCNYVTELANKPIEIEIEDNKFKSFRILTEVL